jgi:hypothetical protein
MVKQKAPVLLLVFNRLETVKLVLNEIRLYQPDQLFIASDGARNNKPQETIIVDAVRSYVLENIDWNCELKTFFRDENVGCGKGVSGAISWFFQHVEQGIILEDDCVPLNGFFQFCEAMLYQYKHDERVFSINGTNLQAGNKRGEGSYYFSNFPDIWGWATWARAWNNYDLNIAAYQKFKENNKINSILLDDTQRKYWLDIFDNSYKVDTWDFQWIFTILNNNALCIAPNANLILNIGFNEEGTHTLTQPSWYKKLTKGNSNIFPIRDPLKREVNTKADDFRFYRALHTSLMQKVFSLIKFKLKLK